MLPWSNADISRSRVAWHICATPGKHLVFSSESNQPRQVEATKTTYIDKKGSVARDHCLIQVYSLLGIAPTELPNAERTLVEG